MKIIVNIPNSDGLNSQAYDNSNNVNTNYLWRQIFVKEMLRVGNILKVYPNTLGKAYYLLYIFLVNEQIKERKNVGTMSNYTYDIQYVRICCIASLFLASKLDDVSLELENCLKLFISQLATTRINKRKGSFNQINPEIECEQQQQSQQSIDDVKYQLFQLETDMLLASGFNLNIQSPHQYLHSYIESIFSKHNNINFNKHTSNNNEQVKEEIFQIANVILNDSYYSDVCIRYRPDYIAATCIYLALLAGINIQNEQQSEQQEQQIAVEDEEEETMKLQEQYSQWIHECAKINTIEQQDELKSVLNIISNLFNIKMQNENEENNNNQVQIVP